MAPLKGKVAIVTGSSRGIGAAIAERLAADGATVVINYVKAASEAEKVADRIRTNGGKAIVIQANVADWTQAKRLVDDASRELGSIDILVNNAASFTIGPFEKITEQELYSEIAVNFAGPFATMQAALPHFPDHGGRIVNISSLGVSSPVAGNSAYAGAKSALEAMSRICAVELGPRGITVNVVAPGMTETEALKENLSQDMKKAMIERTPLGRVALPSDIADVVAFVVSHDARWVTGQILTANGGFIP